MKYQVLVGNIGTVASTDSKSEALKEFNHYVEASKASCGRASGEEVTLFGDGEILSSYN